MSARKRHVLFVDDDPDVCEAIEKLLELRGVRVTTAGDGEEALHLMLESVAPDVIISDIEMPGMGGFDFYQAVRANEAWLPIPFIILTGHNDRVHIRRGQTLGVDGYLLKPFDEDQLMLTIYSRAKRAQELTRYAEAEHNRLEYIRRDMARTFTHELRTPLAFLKPVIELLNRYTERLGEQPEILDLVDALEAGYTRLERLLEQMALLMQWDTGELQKLIYEARRPGPLWDALTAAVNRARSFSYRQTDATIHYHHGGASGEIVADWKSLTHALAELLSNAMAFSPKDGTIEVRQWEDGEHVYLLIADNGPGIAKEKQGGLFRRFLQVEREKHDQQGIGLGLYLARSIIEANGGTLELTSAENQGTTVTARFPLMTEPVQEEVPVLGSMTAALSEMRLSARNEERDAVSTESGSSGQTSDEKDADPGAAELVDNQQPPIQEDVEDAGMPDSIIWDSVDAALDELDELLEDAQAQSDQSSDTTRSATDDLSDLRQSVTD